MKFNNPLPQPLYKECSKAAKIFKSFVDSGNNGLDGVIPRSVLENARGFAIFTVFKAGFVFSARGGSGVVVARLPDGSWSAPSAIGTAGLGVGGQAGAEMTDFLIVLNSESAIRSFMSAGSLTLGGNLSIALGPLGRNGEALGSVSTSGKVAAMYSYSKTKGLFGGVSVEGSVILERQDANALAYESDVSVKAILSGTVPQPEWAAALYQTLDSCTGFRGNNKWVEDAPLDSAYVFNGLSSPRGEPAPEKKKKHISKPSFPPTTWGQPKTSGSYFDALSENSPRRANTTAGLNSNTSNPPWDDLIRQDSKSATANFGTHFQSDFQPESKQPQHQRNFSMPIPQAHGQHVDPFNGIDSVPPAYNSSGPHNRSSSYSVSNSPYPKSPIFQSSAQKTSPTGSIGGFYAAEPDQYEPTNRSAPASTSQFSPVQSGGGFYAAEPDYYGSGHPDIAVKPELQQPLSPHQGVARAIALFDFKAVESGDLSFSKGQVITITEKSTTTDTWWKGTLEGRTGIFPANFVQVI